MRILLVEDDEWIGNDLYLGLLQNNHTVDWVKDGVAAFIALEVEQFDCMVLELTLPRLSGLSLLKKLRKNGNAIPILVVTAKKTVNEWVSGLDAGADDYMTRPFELAELLARLRALQRRIYRRSEMIFYYQNLVLNPAAHSVTVDGEGIFLSRREFALLQKLLENAGHVLSREALTQNLYSWDESIDSNALEVHIHTLRKKLRVDYIRTVRGVGYTVDKADNAHHL